MEMVEMRTDELIGTALDWAVAKTEGLPLCDEACQGDFILIGTGAGDLERFSPSSDWSQSGPLLEQNPWALPRRAIHRHHLGAFEADTPGGFPHNGPTPLIAACRAMVAANLGNVVKVPAELATP